jgi:hypothetical protein
VHGAPETAEESREVLARLKRMAGFESQDFDPGVRGPAAARARPRRAASGRLRRLAWSSWQAQLLGCGSVVMAAVTRTCV